MDYKKYSLEQLSNWIYDAMSCGDATPQEIYDVILDVVKDNYYVYKEQASKAYELLALLNGNGKGHLSCDKDDSSPECKGAWNSFWEEYYYPEEAKTDKVNRWVLPVELDGLSGECYIQLPDDLLERAGLKEGDQVEWIDRGDGSFEMRKV